jgi:hypothetical protein
MYYGLQLGERLFCAMMLIFYAFDIQTAEKFIGFGFD